MKDKIEIPENLTSSTLREQQIMKIKDLTQLEGGETGVVVGIHGGYGLLHRLESLGIRVGKKVTKVNGQFMRGPVTIRIDNSQYAIGFGMARKIMVELEK